MMVAKILAGKQVMYANHLPIGLTLGDIGLNNIDPIFFGGIINGLSLIFNVEQIFSIVLLMIKRHCQSPSLNTLW
jgi:hypothetical protein